MTTATKQALQKLW